MICAKQGITEASPSQGYCTHRSGVIGVYLHQCGVIVGACWAVIGRLGAIARHWCCRRPVASCRDYRLARCFLALVALALGGLVMLLLGDMVRLS